jgi:hypothetical protein
VPSLLDRTLCLGHSDALYTYSTLCLVPSLPTLCLVPSLTYSFSGASSAYSVSGALSVNFP